MAGLDETDRKLIALLQHDDRMSLGELGAEIGAAPSTINDRIKRLVRRVDGRVAYDGPVAAGLAHDVEAP